MNSLEAWLGSIPRSRVAYPETYREYIKYLLWRVLAPLHPYVRDALDTVGLVRRRYARFRPDGRQQYLLGHLAPSETPQTVTEFLIEHGYGNHFVALKDEGEVVGLRYAPNFKYQYHLRIFKDGEVRGHYEYTVECHPFLHDRQTFFEDRRDEFLKLLGHRIIPL